MERYTLQNRKGQTIVGVLHTPRYHPLGTAIISPGWRSHKDDAVIRAMYQACLEAGLRVFVFDATNSRGESDGEFTRSTHGLHYEDLEDVVMWARTQRWGTGPFLVAGHSRGAYAAVRYAQSHPRRVDYLLAVAPIVSGQLSEESFRSNDPTGYAKWQERRPDAPAEHHSGLTKFWSKVRRRVNYDLRPQAHLVMIPTLLVGARKDRRCPPQHLRKLFRRLGARDKEMHIIPHAEHQFLTLESQAALGQTIEQWLGQRIPHRSSSA